MSIRTDSAERGQQNDKASRPHSPKDQRMRDERCSPFLPSTCLVGEEYRLTLLPAECNGSSQCAAA